jgi:Ca2+-binding RTX toxin-like protein
MPGLEDEVTFISGVNADGTIAATSYQTWRRNNPATYNVTLSSASKWVGVDGSSAAGTSGGIVKYYFDPNGAGSADDWTAAEQQAFRAAFGLWQMVANIHFEVTNDPGQADISIRRGTDRNAFNFNILAAASGDQGTIGSTSLLEISQSVISIDTKVAGFGPIRPASDSTSFSYFGGYVWETMIHEIGHALGLGHGGPYNANADSATQQYSPYDVQIHTLMSYVGPEEFAARFGHLYDPPSTSWRNMSGDHSPVTPMLLDILAVQRLYGVSTDPQFSGGLIFGFNSNLTGALAPFYDFTVNTVPVVTLYARGSNNTLDARNFSDNATVNLNAGTHSSLAGLTNNIAIAYDSRIDGLYTGTGKDRVFANDYGNLIDTSAGDDTIFGGTGNDTFHPGAGKNRIHGGLGLDTAAYQLAQNNYNFTQNADGSWRVVSIDPTLGVDDTLIGIELITFAGIGTSINSSAPEVIGGNGDDILFARAGNDYVDGGRGHNTLSYANADKGINVTLQSSDPQSTENSGTDTIIRIQGLVGSSHADTLSGSKLSPSSLFGGNGNDALTGGYRDDYLDGGAGIDTVTYIDTPDGDNGVSLKTGTSRGAFGNDTLVNIENLNFSIVRGKIEVEGSDDDNVISLFSARTSGTIDAGAGNDFMDIRAGAPEALTDLSLSGGSGMDGLKLGLWQSAPISVVFQPGADLLVSGEISLNGFEYFYLDGTPGDDVVTFIAPRAFTAFQDGTNRLQNGFAGAGGNDTAIIDLSQTATAMRFQFGRVESASEAGAPSVVYAEFQDIDTIQIRGGTGNDIFAGQSNSDIFEGGLGNDHLDGGQGFDFASYAHAAVGVTVNLSLSGAQRSYGSDDDTLTNIEGVIGSQHDDVLAGNAGDNKLQGLAGSNRLDGAAGNDTAIYALGRSSYAVATEAGGYRVQGIAINDLLQNFEYLQFGNRVFTAAQALLPFDVHSDFDNDDKADLLWQKRDGQAAVQISGTATIASQGTNLGLGWYLRGSGDLNGDAKPDTVWQHDDGRVMVRLMNGAAILAGGIAGNNMDRDWRVKAVADYDGDRKADIILQHANGAAEVWTMNGLNRQSIIATGLSSGWRIKSAADFNGDGKADFLLQNDIGPVGILFAGAGSVTVASGNTDVAWHVRSAGDFDGDGKSDIVLQHDNGQAAVWLMDGSNLLAGGIVGDNLDRKWQIKTTVDHDGDGKADIVWQHVNGQARIWTMNGLTRLASAVAGASPGTTWQVVADAGARAIRLRSDLDLDGKSDILMQNGVGSPMVYIALSDSVSIPSALGFNNDRSWHIRGNGDFNADGKVDIIWQNDDGQAAIWLMDRMTQLSGTAIGSNTDRNWKIMAGADVNGDGHTDIILRHSDGRLGIWLMDGLNVQSTSVSASPGAGWRIKGRGDFDGDGRDDVLWQNANGQAGIMFSGAGSMILAGSNTDTSWHVRSAGDFNDDGKDDIVWQNDNGQAAIWLMEGSAVLAKGGVGNNTEYKWQIKTAIDHSGDGKADIIWQNIADGQLRVWSMDGLVLRSSKTTEDDLFPTERVIGDAGAQEIYRRNDLDGDGRTDILWRTAGGRAGILLAGTDAMDVSAARPGANWYLQGAGDFNGDGKADMLWQSGNGQIAISLMDGKTLLSGATVGNNSDRNWQVRAVGDYNGDGRSDIAWQHTNGQARIWTISGLAQLSTIDITPSNAGWRIKGAGDFDTDGKSDILWQKDNGQAGILLSGANAITEVGANLGTNWHVRGAGEFTTDGKSHIVWQSDTGQVKLWRMNGSIMVAEATPGTLDASWQLRAIGDYDGNRVDDIVWQHASGQVAVWTVIGGELRSTITVGPSETGWRVVGEGNSGLGVVSSDVNGDGKSDLLWQNSDGQGATWLMDVTTLVVGSTVGVANRSWRIKGAGDFDGDGRADILWQHLDGRVGAMLAGASSVTEVGSNPGASWRVKGAGDLNGDGKADIVLQHENGQLAGWLMDGATFVGGSALGSGGAWQVRDSSDFNGDGKADLLLQHADGQTGLLLAGSSSITEVGSNPGTAWRVRGAGDFNGDGATDILLQHSSGQAATWLMSGTSLLWGATVGGVDATWQARGTSDQDGDGKADILWQNTNGQAGILLAGSSGITNVGNNPGATWRLKGAFDSEGVSDRRSPVHSDFNGDTRADLLWRNDDGQVAAWLMDGASLVAGRGIGSADASWQIRGKGDFNGDGKADILWQNTSGQTAIWTMSSFAMLAGTRVGGADPNWQVKGTGDFNGDGKADILLQHAGSGEVATWIMDGTSLLAGNVLGTVNGTWQVKGTDDFDGDGQDDILWQNTNGQAGIMLAGSSSVTAAGNNPGTAWTIRGAGDFNADGKADILWQANDGQIATWLMDGTAMLTGALVTTADPAWVAKSASDLDSDGRADILLQNTSGQAAIILAGISTILNAGNNPGTAWHVATG